MKRRAAIIKLASLPYLIWGMPQRVNICFAGIGKEGKKVIDYFKKRGSTCKYLIVDKTTPYVEFEQIINFSPSCQIVLLSRVSNESDLILLKETWMHLRRIGQQPVVIALQPFYFESQHKRLSAEMIRCFSHTPGVFTINPNPYFDHDITIKEAFNMAYDAMYQKFTESSASLILS